MNRYAITLGALTAAVGALVSLQASAALVDKYGTMAASGACQAALPNYEGNFRKRPLAVANEGTAAAFLTCGVTNYGGSSSSRVELAGVNRSAAAGDISCTMVDGVIDASLGFANYYPQTIAAVATNSTYYFQWTGSFSQFGQAISCAVPASFEADRVWTYYKDEVGA